jgi:hypothetical protein
MGWIDDAGMLSGQTSMGSDQLVIGKHFNAIGVNARGEGTPNQMGRNRIAVGLNRHQPLTAHHDTIKEAVVSSLRRQRTELQLFLR